MTTRIGRFVLAAMVVAGSLLGCDVQTYDDAVASIGSSPPPPAPPPPGPPPPPPPPPPPVGFGPVFSEIQAQLFTPTCATASCHSGANPPANLNLQEANSYAMLVGIASDQDGNILRVNPGNPDASYLIQKLEGTAGGGVQMPPNNALAQAEIDVVRQWILDGAVDDRAQASDPIRVSSISPPPNAPLTAAPAQIIASFDRDVDPSTVNQFTFLLTASGGDGTFGEANDMPIMVGANAISVPGGNPASAMMDLSGVVLADETYQISLLGDGASVVMDFDANALDGEFFGVFPSGNTTAGGDFTSRFTITTPVVIGPTLDQIQAVVFGPKCSGCHSGPTSNVLPSGMDLTSAAASLAALVNVPSIQQAAIMRVLPGDPDNSYLVRKLEANGVTVMPPTGMLPAAEITAIRDWITAGAPP